MNYINLDIVAVSSFIQFLSTVFANPLIIIISLVLICSELGGIGLLTFVVFILGSVTSKNLSKKTIMARNDILKHKDKRAQSISEFINGIKIVKYYGWENFVINSISHIRKLETAFLHKTNMLRGYIDTIGSLLSMF